jgi:hypothetical protein
MRIPKFTVSAGGRTRSLSQGLITKKIDPATAYTYAFLPQQPVLAKQ